jgi:hypothetical protein
MKAWIVRFASLYAFNLVVLLLIGLLTPARVGWAALWASVLLTAATIWLKPLIAKGFASATAKSAASRTRTGQKLVQYGAVFVVELIIWILVVIFSGISIRGLFWGWVIPPILLLIAWTIYDAVDDRIEARAGELYDSATGRRGATPATGAATMTSTVDPAARVELDDGLTPEQRKMLDDLS